MYGGQRRQRTYCVPLTGSDMQKLQGLGSKIVRPKNMENVRMGSLISTEINIRLGSAPYHPKVNEKI